MKRVLHVLRFFALVFLLFLMIVLCFVLNKALDAKIQASHEEALNNFSPTPTEALYEDEN